MDDTSSPLTLTLELARDVNAITGRLSIEDAEPVAFAGYLELMSLLERARRLTRRDDFGSAAAFDSPETNPRSQS